MKIGIPRALLYFWYGSLWEKFWEACGWEVLTSTPTTPQIMQAGITVAVDELCLPVKIFLGHLRVLAPQVDLILIPHLIKVEPGAFICPKFMGLPDLISHTLPELRTKLLVVKVGPRKTKMLPSLSQAACQAGVSRNRLSRVSREISRELLNDPFKITLKSLPEINFEIGPGKKIGLLGHPYALYDSCFNLNLLSYLTSRGIPYVTPEMIPINFRGIGSGRLNKDLFWTVGKLQFDALEWLLRESNDLAGFIQVTPFACGTEAIVGDLLERRIKEAQLPLLRLNYEEHSGEAGMVTRLEAFLDLLNYRIPAC